MRTYTFPVNDGVAVVIPKELASAGEPSGAVEIERVGDTLVIRPLVRRKLTGLAAKFAAFPAGFMAQGREFHEERERDWGGTPEVN
ncbi:MAG: hypothetical protein RL260_1253 [Pseudomonadota bacterium]|jgi:antitoxin VapB